MIKMNISDAAAALSLQRTGEDVTFSGCSIDSRTVRAGEMFIAIHGEKFDGHDFLGQAADNGAVAALVEKGTTDILPSLCCKDTRYTMGQLASYWRNQFSIPVIAITGSNGKTTVKEMLTAILSVHASVNYTRGNLNNDLGVPLTLFGLGSEHQYAVVEMGANHPGEIARLCEIARPTVAVITQCAPAHLEGFGSIAGVARAKGEIYAGLEQDGIAIINADDEFAGFWQENNLHKKRLTFGLSRPADVTAVKTTTSALNSFVLKTAEEHIEIDLPLPGDHNIANAAAAATCAIALRIPLSQIKEGLENIKPVKGRLQLKTGPASSRIIDDTYNANPGSLLAAIRVLKSLPGKHWLVLGDMGELGLEQEKLHEEAGYQARQAGVERLFAVGDLVKHTVSGFGKGAERFENHEVLISKLLEQIDADVNLLVKGSRSMKMEQVVEALEVKH